jgi:hypothetical protein
MLRYRVAACQICRSVRDTTSGIGQSVRAMWIVVLIFLPLLAYGLLNVFTPRTTLAWQIRSTARRTERDPRSVVGKSFQRWLGINPDEPTDRASLRRIRLLGIAEIFLSVIVIGVAYLATS